MSEELNNINETEGQETETQDTLTLTRDELNQMLQQEADKRVSQAMKTAEAKREKAVREAQKVANMNATEKFQYELEQREAAIAAKERELALAENKNACSKILADKGISLAFVDYVVAEDAETMNANIKTIEKAFKDSVRAEVEKRLGSKEPKANIGTEGMTKEQFNKLPISEWSRIQKEDPELFAKMTE